MITRRAGATRALAEALAVRGLGALSQLGLAVVLGRAYGAPAVGLFFLYVSWSRIGAAFVSLGLPRYLMRRAATTEPRAFTVVFRRTLTSLLSVAVVVAVSALVAVRLIVPAVAVDLLAAAAIGTVGQTLLFVGSDTMRGQGRPSLALFVEFAVVPLCLIAIVLGTFGRLSGGEAVISHAVLSTVIGAIVVALLASERLTRLQVASHERLRPDADPPSVRELRDFGQLAVVNVALMSFPVMILSLFVGREEVAQFAAAQRLIAVAMIILSALESWYSPRFAQAFYARAYAVLNRLRRRAEAESFLLFLPLFVLLMVASTDMLALFGEGFSGGDAALQIMAVGQLVNSASGLSEQLLVMCDRENIEVLILWIALGSLLIVGLTLAPSMEVEGMAVALAVSLAIRSVGSYVVGRRLAVSWRTRPEPIGVLP